MVRHEWLDCSRWERFREEVGGKMEDASDGRAGCLRQTGWTDRKKTVDLADISLLAKATWSQLGGGWIRRYAGGKKKRASEMIALYIRKKGWRPAT